MHTIRECRDERDTGSEAVEICLYVSYLRMLCGTLREQGKCHGEGAYLDLSLTHVI